MPEGGHDSCPLGEDQEGQEDKEGFVVSTSNASTQPLAMMIKSVHTVATKVTMKYPLRSNDLTRVTKLHPSHMCTSIANNQCPSRCRVLPPRLFHVDQSPPPQVLYHFNLISTLTALGMIPGFVMTVQRKAKFVIKLEAKSTKETIKVLVSW